MDVNIIAAFVAGVIIPLIIAVLGKEPLGRLLSARQDRESTALSALIHLAQESIAGWRESNSAVMALSTGLDAYKTDTSASDTRIYAAIMNQGRILGSVESRVTALVSILAGRDPANSEEV